MVLVEKKERKKGGYGYTITVNSIMPKSGREDTKQEGWSCFKKKLNLQKCGKETPACIKRKTLEKEDSGSFSAGKEVLDKEYSWPHWNRSYRSLQKSKAEDGNLTGVAQWVGFHPAKRKVTALISGQGTCLGWGPGLPMGASKRQPINVSLPLFLPPFSFL